MKHRSKTIFIGFMTVSIIFSGCTKTKEIQVSEDVKKSVMAKVEDTKLRNEPVLKGKLNGLDNQNILFWIDNENLLTVERTGEKTEEKLILYSYNLESEKSTEILNENNIKTIYGTDKDGVVLLGNEKQVFAYDVKEKKLEEVLDFDKEFRDGIPGSKIEREKQDLTYASVNLIKKDYISYRSNIKLKDKELRTAEYTILNYRDNKKNIIESDDNGGGPSFKFDLTGKNVYIGEFAQLTKLNLVTGQKSSMELSMPIVQNVFEDGTLFVNCTEENGTLYDKWKMYKVDFDNKKVTKYEENYEGKRLIRQAIDFKNEFAIYLGEGQDNVHQIAMYGTLEGNRFTVKDKLFKNNEEKGCNTIRDFVFSPDHNRFTTAVVISKIEDASFKITTLKKDEYLFELK